MPLAAHVELGGAVVDALDDRLRARAAPTSTRSPIAAGSAGNGRGAALPAVPPRAPDPATGSSAARASLEPRRSSPVGTSRAARRSASAQSSTCALQRGDDLVDLASRLAHLLVELLVQALAERFLALAQLALASAAAGPASLRRLPLARGEPVLVLERAHVVVDLGEVLGELRFARAQLRARRGDDSAGQPEARGDLERQAAARGSVDAADRSARRCRGRSRTPRSRRPRSSTRRSSARRSGSSRSPSRRGGGSDRRSRRRARRLRSGRCPDPTSSSSTSAGSASAAIHRDDVGDVRREGAEARRRSTARRRCRRTASGTPAGAMPSAAGIRRPACAISASSPAVLSATVLPPVFGPGDQQHASARRNQHDLRCVHRHRALLSAADAAPPAARTRRRSRAPARCRRSSREPRRAPAGRRARSPPRSCAAGRPRARGTRRSAPAGCGGLLRLPAPRARRCRC